MKQKKDSLAGEKYGRLTILYETVKENSNNNRKVVCECECGNEVTTRYTRLKNGEKVSCGCIKKENEIEDDNNLIGKIFDMLTVLKVEKKNGFKIVTVSCDCGMIKEIRRSYLNTKHFKSCGCRPRNTTHGLSETPTYITYASMKHRCMDKNNINYGGRGVKVCDRWLESFENFYEDMGDRPDGCTLDRIDVNGNYEPSNCRWADNTTQLINQRHKSRKTKHKNIDEFKSRRGTRYRASISRKGLIRRCTPSSDLKSQLMLRDKWIAEYEDDPNKWIEDTISGNYDK